jgi:hypothetical protein
MGGLPMSFKSQFNRIISLTDNTCFVCQLDIVKYIDSLIMSGVVQLEILPVP